MSSKIIAIVEGQQNASVLPNLIVIHGHVDFKAQGGNEKPFTALLQNDQAWKLQDVTQGWNEVTPQVLEWLNSEDQMVRVLLGIHPDAAITSANLHLTRLIMSTGMTYPIQRRKEKTND
jgi:hypothetical protein